jgi:hydroxypyruvate isomerase
MRVAANLSMLYRELPYVDRFAQAAADGFEAVESWWPGDEDPDAVVAAARDAGLPLVLLNIEAGDLDAGERGFFNRPQERRRVMEATRTAIDLASRTGCRQLNALVGNRVGDDPEVELRMAVPTLREAGALAHEAGMRLTIEVLNGFDTPRYLVQSTARAGALVADIGHGAGIQLDTYHLGRMGEDLVQVVRELGHQLAHVQVADHPGRHEPGTGELPFDAFFAALGANGYQGDIGLEFLPTRPVRETLASVRARLANGVA